MTEIFTSLVCVVIVSMNALVWGDNYGAGWDWKPGCVGIVFSVLLVCGGALLGGAK